MTLINQLMPAFRLRQVDHVAVAAPPDRAWDALEPICDDATLIITRVRAEYTKSLKLGLVTSFMSAAHAVMGRTQLRNVKRRAERLAAAG